MEHNIHAFDWQRMFFGDQSYLFLFEVAFRTTFMYLYAIIAARFMGKRGMGQLTPFEYIIVIALGSATGDPMFYPHVPLFHGIIVLSVIVLLQRIISNLSEKSSFFSHQIESTPTLLIHNGKINSNSIKKADVTEENLRMRLRLQKIRDIGEVEYAFLEPTGKLSVFKLPKIRVKKHQTTLPRHIDEGK